MGSYDDSLGALFIGVILAAVLYGFTCIQTWYYLIHYPSDRWYTKLLVLVILLTDTIHQAIITLSIYTYLVTNWGVPSILETVVWSLTSEVFFNASTAFLVQCFLVWRIHILGNKNWAFTGVSGSLIIAQFVLSMIYSSRAVTFTTYAQLATLKSLSKSVNVITAVGDVVIALMLCVLLRRKRTGFEKSNSLISKLIVFSINTGLLTSVFALASLISISAWPHSLAYVTFYFCMGRLYCNTLLATLNARKILRGKALDDETALTNLSSHQTTNHRIGTKSAHSGVPSNISIMVDTTRECTHDVSRYSSTCDVKVPEVVAV